jgi:membrane associated rhomboid family serine protease
LIPLRDTIPSRTFPILNWTMIALCAVGFLLELSAGARVEALLHEFGLIPARFFALRERGGGTLAPYLPFVTSAFLHAGWAHFLGNMLYLWIFGDNVEDRLGHLAYALFYVAGAVFAGAAQALSNPASTVPMVGASGAIAAVMGAYFVLFPRARIESLVIFGFWIDFVSVPAVFYLAIWFAMQLLSGAFALATAGGAQGGVAWWAHAGGFAFGMGIGWLRRVGSAVPARA